MMVVLMGAAVGFDQLDPAALDFIHGSYVNSVGAYNFHVLGDPR